MHLLVSLKERAAEFRFPLIAPRTHAHEGAANAPGEPRTARSIEKRAPHHVARDRQTDPADPNVECARDGP